MKVKLIAMTQGTNGETPMDIIEQAACMCYKSTPTENHRIAEGCFKTMHHSVFEHASFTFKVEGVSRALLAQLTRHRIASFSVASQRYISYAEEFEYVNPFSEDTVSFKLFQSDMRNIQDYYNKYINIGEKNENARAVLPNACCTDLVFTMNARELINASSERLCSRAQKEIREMFQMCKNQLEQHCPEIAEKMRPKCEKNAEYPFCTESKSCGRHPKLSKVYKKY